MSRRNQTLTLMQATLESPTLSRLAELSEDSVARLKAIEPIIPTALRSAITAGPIDGANWCLIVNSSAAAAKIRQVLPALQTHLQAKGWEVTSIRLRVQLPGQRPSGPA
ncbi:MAG: hypothetical protein OEV31_05640 [Gammaproteobacteria bacterium]|nr:hypothetical protein [Gammaproteobacteria bacterium]